MGYSPRGREEPDTTEQISASASTTASVSCPEFIALGLRRSEVTELESKD